MNPFVILLVILDFGAVAWELYHGNPIKAWYWTSAASITGSTVFLK